MGITLTGGRNATEQALMDAFRNREGKTKAMGFVGANHGQGLAMTQFAHPQMSLSMGWPSLDYPATGAAEEQTLERVRSAVNGDVAAIMVEPVNWQTGEQMSDSLISQIGKIAHENEAALIVDETNTGCGATGRGFWAYNGASADYLTFGKRTQATGFFHAGEGMSLSGSELDVRIFAEIYKEVEAHNLVELVERVGKSMHQQVSRAAESSSRITGVQAAGTMLWINTANGQDAQELRDHMRREGVIVKLNGVKGVVCKPALTFQEGHIQQLSSAVARF
jgi:4-aminobutyrate aminotransferase-like enzyme